MVRKYVRALEERRINSDTGEVWKVDDVGNLWREKVLAQIAKDGYIVAEDGTVVKPENEGE